VKYILAIIIADFIGNMGRSYFIGRKSRNMAIRDNGGGTHGAHNEERGFGDGPCF